MKRTAVLIGVSLMVFFASSVFAAEADGILGKWWNEKKDAHIQIYKCDAGYCGKIAYLKEPVYNEKDTRGMAGKPKVDRENPDPAKRTNPIIGLNIISGFTYAGENVWEGGTIYDPEEGKTYKCKLTLEKPDKLKVRGYIGTPLLGKTQYWMRVK
jgi:uncharacterized protein (DUF2147 family)